MTVAVLEIPLQTCAEVSTSRLLTMSRQISATANGRTWPEPVVKLGVINQAEGDSRTAPPAAVTLSTSPATVAASSTAHAAAHHHAAGAPSGAFGVELSTAEETLQAWRKSLQARRNLCPSFIMDDPDAKPVAANSGASSSSRELIAALAPQTAVAKTGAFGLRGRQHSTEPVATGINGGTESTPFAAVSSTSPFRVRPPAVSMVNMPPTCIISNALSVVVESTSPLADEHRPQSVGCPALGHSTPRFSASPAGSCSSKRMVCWQNGGTEGQLSAAENFTDDVLIADPRCDPPGYSRNPRAVDDALMTDESRVCPFSPLETGIAAALTPDHVKHCMFSDAAADAIVKWCDVSPVSQGSGGSVTIASVSTPVIAEVSPAGFMEQRNMIFPTFGPLLLFPPPVAAGSRSEKVDGDKAAAAAGAEVFGDSDLALFAADASKRIASSGDKNAEGVAAAPGRIAIAKRWRRTTVASASCGGAEAVARQIRQPLELAEPRGRVSFADQEFDGSELDEAEMEAEVARLERELLEVDGRVFDLESEMRSAEAGTVCPRGLLTSAALSDASTAASLHVNQSTSSLPSYRFRQSSTESDAHWRNQAGDVERAILSEDVAIEEAEQRIHWLEIQLEEQPQRQEEKMRALSHILADVAHNVEAAARAASSEMPSGGLSSALL